MVGYLTTYTFVSAVGYSYLLVSLAPRLDIDHHLINIQPSPNLVLINFSRRSTQLDFLLAIKVVAGF